MIVESPVVDVEGIKFAAIMLVEGVSAELVTTGYIEVGDTVECYITSGDQQAINACNEHNWGYR